MEETNQNKNDHYVYALVDNKGVIRYIGEGRKQRYKERGKYKRSLEYRDILDNGGEVKIIHSGLTKSEAIAKEDEYLTKYLNNFTDEFNLINKVKSRKQTTMKYLDFVEYFKIDSSSVSGLSWVKSPTPEKPSKAKIGSQAGSLESNGYYRVGFKGKRYLVHRVIWILHSKEDLTTDYVINHKDSNKGNNSIVNLEKVTFRTNSIKRKSTSDNVGVILSKSNDKEVGRFIAHCTDLDGNLESKTFSISKLGYNEAFELAKEYRKSLAEKYYGIIG